MSILADSQPYNMDEETSETSNEVDEDSELDEDELNCYDIFADRIGSSETVDIGELPLKFLPGGEVRQMKMFKIHNADKIFQTGIDFQCSLLTNRWCFYLATDPSFPDWMQLSISIAGGAGFCRGRVSVRFPGVREKNEEVRSTNPATFILFPRLQSKKNLKRIAEKMGGTLHLIVEVRKECIWSPPPMIHDDKLRQLWKDAREKKCQNYVTIRAGGSEFPVDLEVIRERGGKLPQLMYETTCSHPNESANKTRQIETVEVDMGAEQMQAVLKYVYTDLTREELQQLGFEKLLELFEIADKYNLIDLKLQCEFILATDFIFENEMPGRIFLEDVDRAVRLFIASQKTSSSLLEEACLRMYMKHALYFHHFSDRFRLILESPEYACKFLKYVAFESKHPNRSTTAELRHICQERNLPIDGTYKMLKSRCGM